MYTLRKIISVSTAAAFSATLSLFGFACKKGSEQAQPAEGAAAVPATGTPSPAAEPQGRLIPVAVTDEGFSPSSIDAKAGETITLRFTRTTKSECLKAISIPDLKISKDLPMNTPVDVTIKPERAGAMTFQCWMAMVKGKINVAGS